MSLPEPFSTEAFTPVCTEKQHEMTLNGQTVAFTSVCEDTVFYSPNQQPEASIFTISYIRTDADPDRPRPVAFLWNGGPGSATSTLHLECFGPWLMETDNGKPIYGLAENPLCLLDICDLVFVDPVGVGLSRLLNPEKAGKYYSVDGDARSVAFLIVEWLRKHHRWHSPITLIGESFGTVRACRVLAELGRSPMSESRMVLGIPVDRVVLIGLATSKNQSDIDPTLALMPAMAATKYYHDHDGSTGPELEAFAEEAWKFAADALLRAYFQGDALTDTDRADLARRLESYTGLSRDYWVSHDLHLGNTRDFMTMSLPGFTLDLYDSRNRTPAGEPYNEIGSGNMPIQIMNGLLLPRLGCELSRIYYTGNINVNVQFNYETEPLDPPFMRSHLDCLRDSMKANDTMQVLFASGLFDLCTYAGNTRYVVSHAGLPKGRVQNIFYPGGHGVYSSPEGKAAFLKDVRESITRS